MSGETSRFPRTPSTGPLVRTGASRREEVGCALTRGGVSALGSAAGAGLGLFLFARDLLADLLQGPSNEARDVHLRDADLLSDLRLRQPLEETQVQNHP